MKTCRVKLDNGEFSILYDSISKVSFKPEVIYSKILALGDKYKGRIDDNGEPLFQDAILYIEDLELNNLAKENNNPIEILDLVDINSHANTYLSNSKNFIKDKKNRWQVIDKNFSQAVQDISKLNEIYKKYSIVPIFKLEEKYDNDSNSLKTYLVINQTALQDVEKLILNESFKTPNPDKITISKGDYIGSVLERIANDPVSPYQNLAKDLYAYGKNHLIKPVKYITKEESETLLNRKLTNQKGFYLPDNGTIYIIIDNNNPLSKDIESVLLHEIIHAISYDILNGDSDLSKQFDSLYKKAKKIFEKEKILKYDENGKSNIYGFTNKDEFLAEYFTNDSFRKLLDSKKLKEGDSLFERIINFIASIFGIKNYSQTIGQELLKLNDDLLRKSLTESSPFVPKSETDFLTTHKDFKVLFSETDPQKEVAGRLERLEAEIESKVIPGIDKTRYVKNGKKGIRTTEFNGSKILADYLGDSKIHFDEFSFRKTLDKDGLKKYENKKQLNSEVGTFMHKLVELAFEGKTSDEIKLEAIQLENDKNEKYIDKYSIDTNLDNLIKQAIEIKNTIRQKFPENKFKVVSEVPMFMEDTFFTDKFLEYLKNYKINEDDYADNPEGLEALRKELMEFKNFQGIGGRGDLLLIDEFGNVTILDFKFSSSEYSGWNENKRRSVALQQKVYKQMLKEMGINVSNSLLFTGTIKSDDSHENLEKIEISTNPFIATPNFDESLFSKIFKNSVLTKEEIGDSANHVKEIERIFFNKEGKEVEQKFTVSDQEVEKFKQNYVKLNKNGEEQFYNKDTRKYEKIEGDGRDQIRLYLLKRKHQQIQTVDNVKDYLKRFAEAQVKHQTELLNNPNSSKLKELVYYDGLGNKETMTAFLAYYADDFITEVVETEGVKKVIVKPKWEVLEIPELSSLGIVGLLNREMGVVEFLALENAEASDLAELKLNQQSLIGNFANIQTAHKYGINLAPTSSNINAIKTFLYYLSNKRSFDIEGLKFGGVKTVNLEGEIFEPKAKFIDTPTLMQNAKGMLQFAKDTNIDLGIFSKVTPELLNIDDVIPDYRKTIMFVIDHMLDRNLSNIVGRSVHYEEGQIAKAKSFREKLKKIGEPAIEDEEIEISARNQLLNALKERFNYIASQAGVASDKGFVPETLKEAYKREMEIISQAIIDIENLKIYSDSDLSEKTLTLGENVMLTNPDDITKSMIVEIVKLQNKAYARLKDRMIDDIQGGGTEGGLRTIFKELFNGKDDERSYLDDLLAGRDILMKLVVGNKLPTYYNLEAFEKQYDGTYKRAMRFRDPDNDTELAPGQSPLTEREKKFIRKISNFLWKYRKDRGITDISRKLEIPLMPGDSGTTFRQRVREKGFIKAASMSIKEEMDDLVNVDKAFQGDVNYRERFRKRIEMSDIFAIQDNDVQRQRLMESKTSNGVTEHPVFEDDLEYVIMNYAMNHIKKEEYDRILPTVNAMKTLFVLKHGGMVQNYPSILKYVDMLIRTNIYGKKGVIEEDEQPAAIMGRVTSLISTLAIGLKPGAAIINLLTNTYQTISSLYGINASDIKKADYLKAFNFTMRDLKNNLSNINALNYMSEYFGIHQMDPKKIISETREDKKGLLNNFNRWMHFMNSAPDFMFRMNMFIAEGLTDGVLDIENGKFTKDSAIIFDPISKSIKYDPKKDKRFKEYLNGNREHPDYLKQESLYIATKKALEEEGYVDDMGQITRPYTTRQLYGMQKRADRIYQEMSPENKTWFERTAIGNLVMMFKRWVLSKRNLYWKEAYIDDNLGNFETIEYKDENGQTKYITEWRGRPMEGILNSLLMYLAEVKKSNSPIQAWESLNEYQRNNLNHGLMDSIQFLLIAAIVSALGDDDTIGEKKTGEEWMLRILNNSGKDLFIGNVVYSTATSPIVAVSYTERVLTDLYNGKMPHLRIGLINDVDKIVAGYNR